MQKVWNIKKYNEEEIDKISNKYNISKCLAKLLKAREVEDIDMYLNGTLKDLRDPFLLKDMQKIVERIKLAINKKEKICIYGDYDVDGITSITIMYKFLSDLGLDVMYYLPDRLQEGYGVNNEALDKIKKEGVSLVITVDCGITAIDEVEYAKNLGLDIAITDHHECTENLPSALAIINPKQKDDNYPFKMFAGVGVAFKVLSALAISLNMESENYLKYLDIVAIGTISDIVPLLDENRIISKDGLKQIANTKNEGIKAMLRVINFKDIDSTMVSFGMAPRINACGRMGDASIAVKLLLEESEENAKELAEKLDSLNIKRQEVEKNIFEEAVNTIENEGYKQKNSIVLYDENWHNGVIGIVASRLVNIYNKPVVLFTKENDVVRGSGRCPNGFSLYDALTESKEYLIQFGGHELAAGMSIEEENIPLFREEFEKIVTQNMKDLVQVIDVDMEIKKSDLGVQILKDINRIKPYGQSNNTPLFLYKGLKIHSIRTLKEEKHLKFTLQDERVLLEALAFSQGARRDEVRLGDKIDVLCNVEINSYNTPRTIQLILQDFKKTVD